MRPMSTWIRLSAIVALTAALLPACGEGTAGESAARGGTTGALGSAASTACPSVEDMSKAVGSPVTFIQSLGGSPWMTCQYELTGRYRGVFVELMTQPSSRANDVYARLRQLTKGMKGQDATPDSIALGDGGWAFGSESQSRAAVVARGRLYQASMEYLGFESIGDQKDAMVRVLELAIR